MTEGFAAKAARGKFRRELWGPFITALKEYELLREGDRVAVCISGGKDSALLAVLMDELHRHSDFPFDVEYITMDPGYSPENRAKLEENARALGIPLRVFETNVFRVATRQEKSPCYLCARMRRGHLYNYARELGCSKIALGHHMTDAAVTTLMGMIWGSQISGMLPRLKSTNFEGMELIRPLFRIKEEDIERWARYCGLEFLGCACPMTSDDERHSSKRAWTKQLIRSLEKECPDIEINLFNSTKNVMLDTLMGYKENGEERSFLERFGDGAFSTRDE
ncbi:MAG: tRNA 2-thiocytidine biosynthesis protein TtcA [Clostridia bacterium]|nr:tRNA 2-thiocytidine biosynthesis protein TtcA [Clostridia bacterium]